MQTRTIPPRRAAGLYVLIVCLLAGVLLANAAYAQTTPAGDGNAGSTLHHPMRRMMMSHACAAGAATGGAMAPQHCRGHDRHRMLGRTFHAPAAAAPTAPAAPTAADAAAAVQSAAPADLITLLASADPARGERLTIANGCIGCHSLDPNRRMVGPTWHDLAETSRTRVAGQSAEQYLYTSIVQPDAYIAPGYLPNIMVQNYGRRLSEDNLADIVSYLLTVGE